MRGPRNGPRTPPAGGHSFTASLGFGFALSRLFLQELFELFGEERSDLEEVADDAVVGDLEDRRLGILVDRADHLRRAHAGQVLDGAGNPEAQIELGRDRAAGLADLEAMRPPAR